MAEAKTAKNRAKRQKKKERAKEKGKGADAGASGAGGGGSERDGAAVDIPLKKRRLVNGQELVFKRPGEDESDEEGDVGPLPSGGGLGADIAHEQPVGPVDEGQKITIHEDD